MTWSTADPTCARGAAPANDLARRHPHVLNARTEPLRWVQDAARGGLPASVWAAVLTDLCRATGSPTDLLTHRPDPAAQPPQRDSTRDDRPSSMHAAKPRSSGGAVAQSGSGGGTASLGRQSAIVVADAFLPDYANCGTTTNSRAASQGTPGKVMDGAGAETCAMQAGAKEVRTCSTTPLRMPARRVPAPGASTARLASTLLPSLPARRSRAPAADTARRSSCGAAGCTSQARGRGASCSTSGGGRCRGGPPLRTLARLTLRTGVLDRSLRPAPEANGGRQC